MLNKLLPLFLLISTNAFAASSLTYLELQGVASYSSNADKIDYSSYDTLEAMQKPSVGLDYLKRFSSEYGDWGVLSLQPRISYDESSSDKLQAQAYNAYFKLKYDSFDVWFGHNRPAFSMSSYLDSHGLLLQPLSMEGLGKDLDWGTGTYAQFDNGDLALSLTTGSGMSLRAEGNYNFCARYSNGILERDNYTAGLSLSYGSVLDTMGYNSFNDEPENSVLGALDLAYVFNNADIKFEYIAGNIDGVSVYGMLARFGFGFLDENRLKLELQPVFTKLEDSSDARKIYTSVSYALTSAVTLRFMYQYNDIIADNRFTGQIYYYNRI